MRQHITRPWLIGSALLLGLSGSAAAQDAPASSAAAPKQKALISFDGDFFARFKSENKVTAAQPSGQHKALLPPNSIINRQVPAQTSPVALTHLPPTQMAVQPAVAQMPTARPQAQPIATTLPAGANLAQMAQAQSPFAGPQTPVIIMVPPGWQPDGSVTFAPRTIVSPEVPAEHWPTSQRNPFGDGSKKGLFSWPEIAKKMTSETLQEGPAPQRPPSKALLGGTTEATPAPAMVPSKALFGPKQVAPEPVEVATPGQSRALFNFGRKTAAPAASPAPTAVPQMADRTPQSQGVAQPAMRPAGQPNMQQPSGTENLDPSEQPPAAPTLSELPSEPSRPAVTQAKTAKPQMNWRSKGSLSSTVVETPQPAEASVEIVDADTETHDPLEPVSEQVLAIEEQPAGTTAASLVENQTPSPAIGQPAASTGRSLLGKYFPQMVPQADGGQRAPRNPWQRQAERDALAASKSKQRTDSSSKALVPNLAALIPGLEIEEESATPMARVATQDAAVQRVQHYVTPSHATAARATQSYYAPPAEHIVAEEMDTTEPQPPSSRRGAVRSEPAMDELVEEESELEVIGDDPFRERAPQPMPRQVARQPQRPASKGYRRLTGNDIAAGISKPFAKISELTKLPQAVTLMADGLEEQQPELAPRERVVSTKPVKRYRLFDDATPATGEADDVEAPAIRSRRRRTHGKPVLSDAKETEIEDQPRSAQQIKNKHGVRVTIFSGSELNEEAPAESSHNREAAYTAGGRENPLR